MRIGKYEILRSSRWCYQLYELVPGGFDNKKAKYRKSPIDGGALKPLDCYPIALCAAIEKAVELNLRDGVDVSDIGSAADTIRGLMEEMRGIAESICEERGEKR